MQVNAWWVPCGVMVRGVMKHRRVGADEGLQYREACQQVDRSGGEVM